VTLETGFISWFMVALFACFMPLTAFSFRRFRFEKKLKQFKIVLDHLNIKDHRAEVALGSLDQEFSGRDYIVPVAFITCLSFLGGVFFVFGGSLDLLSIVNIPLEGGGFKPVSGDALATIVLYQHKSMVIVGWAFAGAFVWSMQNILRRLVMVDLQPAAYYSMSVRIILAVLVALIIFHGADGVTESDTSFFGALSDKLLPALAFVIGTVPYRWLQFVKTKISKFGDKVGKTPTPTGDEMLPLDAIQGMNSYHRARLTEVGIDNSQNLAMTGLVTLMTKTPFDPKLLLDWIGQAMLHIRFGDKIGMVHASGIRTVYDFWRLGDKKASESDSDGSGSRIELLQRACKVENDVLLLALFSVRADERVSVLAEYERALSHS